MKILKHSLVIAALLFGCVQVQAQTDAKAKKSSDVAAIKQAIESKSFVFVPQYVRPDGGKETYLNPELNYELTFDDGVLDSYLPNNGEYGIYPNSLGAQFKTTNYESELKPKAKGYSLVFKMKKTAGTTRVAIEVTENGKNSTVRLTNLNYYIPAVTLTGCIMPLKSNAGGAE